MPVSGTAVMWSDDAPAAAYELGDISLGGCRLRRGPVRSVGDHCAAVLNVADQRPVAVPARVVRQIEEADGTTGVALSFTSTAQTRRLLRLVEKPTDGHESIAETDCVLVVHSVRRTRELLSDCLERLGYDVIAVASPFEAIWALEHQQQRIRAVLVSTHLDATNPSDLIHFIARRHPNVKRVLMPSDPSECPANDFDPDIDHIVMDAPWDVWSLFAEMAQG